MADPLTLTFAIFSIVSSTTAFSATLHDTLRKIREHEPELRKQIDDISVLVAVLQECGALFMSDIRIPEAAEGAMDACVSRHHDLVAVMHQIEVYRSRRPSQFSKFLQSARIIARERERKAAFDAFRDSVLLLRDLASEVRLNQQLVDMSASLAQIMSEYADEELGSDEKDREYNSRALTHQHGRDTEESQHRPQSITSHSDPRRGRKAAMQEFSNLIKSNFTRDIRLVVQTSVEQTPWQFKYVPARAKLDTGCEENLVSLELLKANDVHESLLKPIPGGEETPLDGLDSTYIPEFEIQLAWYQGHELIKRRSKFYVVNDPPFEILIGMKRFVHDITSDFRMPNPALIIASRSKTKDEIALSRAKREQARQEAKELEMAELAEFARGSVNRPGNPDGTEGGQDGATIQAEQSGTSSETTSGSVEKTDSSEASSQ